MDNQAGVIDIGSNTVRLVIYKWDKEGNFSERFNFKERAKLRSHLDDEKKLSKEGLQILLKTLKQFAAILKEQKITKISAFATAAIRQASNQKEILKAIEKETQLNVKVISGEQEAFYGYYAVINSTSVNDGFTVDIGGGSTEITIFSDRNVINTYSIPIGALSLSNQFISGDKATDGEMTDMAEYIRTELDKLKDLNKTHGPLIGIGGSSRSVAQIHQSQVTYPIDGLHQYNMHADEVSRIRDLIREATLEDIDHLEGLSKDRADTIEPAIEIFYQLMKKTGSQAFILSRQGIREGVLQEQYLGQDRTPSGNEVAEKSIESVMKDLNKNKRVSRWMEKLVRPLYKDLSKIKAVSFDPELAELATSAAKLYGIGKAIDGEADNKHTFYILANRNLNGFTHLERVKIALMASFKSKKTFEELFEPFRTWYNDEEKKQLHLLGALIKLTFALNISGSNIVKSIAVKENQNLLTLALTCRREARVEAAEGEKRKYHLEKCLKRPIGLRFKS